MKSDGIIKLLATVFMLVLALYILAFSAIEHHRSRNGPWQVTFTNNPDGAPEMIVSQPRLAITNVRFVFPGGASRLENSRLAAHLEMTQPRETPFDVPFGRCVFLDLTSLPGTMVFELFGHEIQLLPRVLTVDKVEKPWRSGEVFTLSPVGSIPETNQP